MRVPYQPVGRLFWHIYATPAVKAIVVEQLAYVPVDSWPITANITYQPGDEHLIDEIQRVISESPVAGLIDVQVMEAAAYEHDTLHKLWLAAEQYQAVGYFHTKGALHPPKPAGQCDQMTELWRRFMTLCVVSLHRSWAKLLDSCDYVSPAMTDGLEGQLPYSAGNFWLASSDYIRRLPEPVWKENYTRWDCELWVGLGAGQSHSVCDWRLVSHLAKHIETVGAEFDIDKKSHGYMPFYDAYLLPLRSRPARLLEIGVWRGNSLRMWQKAMPHWVIEGLDLQPSSVAGCRIHVGNQADRKFLAGLPGYDVVIDDGGHRSQQQIISLVSLIRHTELYVIEDLHTSLPPLYASYHTPGELTCLEYLRQYPRLKPDYITPEEHRRLAGRRIFIEQGRHSPIAFILRDPV